MERTLFMSVFLLIASLSIVCVMGEDVWRVGTGSRLIIPPVDGNTDYVVPIPNTDCCSPGTFVRRFEFGNIGVGNGAPDCHWVRDQLKVRVAAIGPDPNGKTAVFLASEVYMLFNNDLQQYFDGLESSLGSTKYASLYFMVAAQHNHEGPDTSGLNIAPINHEYYAWMIQQMIDATLDALDEDSAVECDLFFGQDAFYYGLGDARDPRITDASVRVLRAYRRSDTKHMQPPVVTMIQWAMHPEVTLGYAPDVNQANCSALPIPQTNCSAEGRYLTADYPGHFARQLVDLYGGGEALYFNGAIGVQIGNHAPVWEPTPQHPVGNGSVFPHGAAEVPKNFRRAYLIGRELAVFTKSIATTNSIPYEAMDFRSREIYASITNFAFRVGLCPASAVGGDPNRPLRIGDTLRMGYNCDLIRPPSPSTCTEDDYAYAFDSVSGLPFRTVLYMREELNYMNNDVFYFNWIDSAAKTQPTAQYLKSVVNYIKLGPVRFISIPGEISPELVTGLPKDFNLQTKKYFENPEDHVTGANYTFPGTVYGTVTNCSGTSPCWVFGLAMDEIGYMFPLSDWRIKCVASDEDCLKYYAVGALNYTDSVAGSACQYVTQRSKNAQQAYTEQFGAEAWKVVNASCYYGQVKGEAKNHYEETNSASWDVASTYLQAVAEMLNLPLQGRYCNDYTCAALSNAPIQ